jgi:Tfp pilus assembly PilM family ATPase
MTVPFHSKRRDQIVAVDLGTRTTKAVYLQRKGERFSLSNFTLHDAPVYEKKLSPEMLAEHLKSVMQSLGARTKQMVLVIGVNDSLLRHAELPPVPVSEMRMMLKFNAKSYLQQDLTDYVFDCHILPPRGPTRRTGQIESEFKVLVGGAKRHLIDDLQTAAKIAGLVPSEIVPSLIGPVNAFEAAQPEIFFKEVVALVDVGFKSSTISILLNGELILSRVVARW